MDLRESKSREMGASVKGLVQSCAILAGLVAPAALIAAAVANRGVSTDTLLVAAIGGGICWAAAALALAALFFGNRFQAPVQGALIGMLFRMGLPLAAIIGLPQLEGSLATRGVVATILGVYLVALVSETVLAVRMVPKSTAVKAA